MWKVEGIMKWLHEWRERRQERIRVRAFMMALGLNGDAIEREARRYEAEERERSRSISQVVDWQRELNGRNRWWRSAARGVGTNANAVRP